MEELEELKEERGQRGGEEVVGSELLGNSERKESTYDFSFLVNFLGKAMPQGHILFLKGFHLFLVRRSIAHGEAVLYVIATAQL